MNRFFLGNLDYFNQCRDNEHDDVDMEAGEDDDVHLHDEESHLASSEGEGEDIMENMEQ